ncbi:hypothetical protein HMN09_01208000 [Mycena chlorophos]|uniref:F-box domain-containing protein n=1 Tax=Mycena chlorophos TaxID=658473 RepID=A0A8H6S8L3_MYCCL|nr:hypothetical protein HMN09_01208000 [Mycena chlorophos]
MSHRRIVATKSGRRLATSIKKICLLTDAVMHPCLGIPEIALHIVQDAAEGYWSPETCRRLARLARTCRAFSEPALDALWRRPGSEALLRLVHTFPSGLLRITTPSEYGKPYQVVVVRSLRETDWERPQFYARRVRELNIDGYFSLQRFKELVLFLTAYTPTEILFPRLRSLTWRACDSNALRFFLASSLNSLVFDGPAAQTLSLLPIVQSRNLDLQTIELNLSSSMVGDQRDIGAISRYVRSFNRLVSVAVPYLDAPAMRHIRSLPTLEHLEFEGIDPGPQDASESPTFLSLKSLNNYNSDVTALKRLLPLFSNSPLEGLFIDPWKGATTTSKLTELFASLEVLSSATPSLDRFSLHTNRFMDAGSSWTLKRAAVLHLRQFTSLTSIMLSSASTFDFGDDTIADLLDACPRMMRLHLTQPEESDTEFTASVLVGIAIRAPLLWSLSITIDASDPPAPSAYTRGADGKRIIQTKLIELLVGYSTLEEDSVFPLARLLSSIFPALEDISGEYLPLEVREEENQTDPDAIEQDVWYQRWKRVSDLHPDLVEIRREEQGF